MHASDDSIGQMCDMIRNNAEGVIFHITKAHKTTLKKKHDVYLSFSGALRDGIFMVDPY
jgi:hypothetical protein